MSKRFYLEGPWNDPVLEVTGQEAHHLLHVMRAGVGEDVEIFDGAGRSAAGTVVALSRKSAQVEWNPESVVLQDIPKPVLVLAVALPKGDRFRWLIEKATELGVSELIPLQTTRSTVSPREAKLDKHRQYIIDACKQSGRNHLMKIADLQSLEEVCQEIRLTETLAIYGSVTEGSGMPLQERLQASSRILVMVGPEGGWTDDEEELIKAHNSFPMHLGQFVLRTETAALALTAALIGLSGAGSA